MVLQRMMSVWNGLHHHVGSSGFGFKLSQARPTNLSRAADLLLQCMYYEVSSGDKYLCGVEFTKLKYWWLTANSTSDFSISFCWCNSECTCNCLECLFQRDENAWGSSSLSWIQCDKILLWLNLSLNFSFLFQVSYISSINSKSKNYQTENIKIIFRLI